jgi:hypothetical protein
MPTGKSALVPGVDPRPINLFPTGRCKRPLTTADSRTPVGNTFLESAGKNKIFSNFGSIFKRFQSFGAVMGMDWHSSGITASVLGALKQGLAPLSKELGIHVCGGRGKHSRATPAELEAVGERVGLDGLALARLSRLIAKVDSAAVQDGFDLYLHSFIVADDGRWVVVQQGMNGDRQQARRYHWLSEGLESFVNAPMPLSRGWGRARSSIWPTVAPLRHAILSSICSARWALTTSSGS